MMGYEWNALRRGDPVRLHRSGGPVEPGTVAYVTFARGSNAVGIRTVSKDGAVVSWPSRMAVHAATGDTDDPGSPCLRCAALRREQS